MTDVLRIGTRGSRLALVQTDMVAHALKAAAPGLRIEIVKIMTSGDWRPEHGETPLPEETGGKAHFAKEIEEALLTGAIDCAVHSLKDMTAVPPPGLAIDHTLARADARDAFLANDAVTLDDLPEGATVGTASPRRKAFLLARRPDLRVVPLRGNVPTRIEKLRNRQVDATLLAVAGLARLDLMHEIASVFEVDEMLPPACQGIIGIERRADDAKSGALLDLIHHASTGLCAAAERSAVAALGGTCHTPLGVYAAFDNAELVMHLELASPDGRHHARHHGRAPVSTPAEAAAFGAALGAYLRESAPSACLC